MAAPKRLTLRTYQVGFGDCFLLSFRYAAEDDPTRDRHVLIDFGSTGQPKNAGDKLMLRVAEDIAEACQGKLHAVVATHRHKDHTSGFATNAAKSASEIFLDQTTSGNPGFYRVGRLPNP